MHWNEEKVRENIRKASTLDLLDRITAYRKGMEPEAIEWIEDELYRRGVTAAQIAEHREECERECIMLPDGMTAMCSFCRRPAVAEGLGWHRVFGVLPLFPRWFRYCKEHAEPELTPSEAHRRPPA